MRREHPDALVLSLKMSERNGIAVLQKIRNLSPGQPVIVLTGGGRVEMEQQVRTLWVTEFVVEGFSLDGDDECILSLYHEGADGNKPLTASGENFALFYLNGHQWAGPIERPR